MLPSSRRRPLPVLWPTLFLAALSVFGPARAALAADLIVTSAADDGTAGTLRQAIANAQSGDTITFDPTVFATQQTISLTSGELNVGRSLTITGPSAGVALDGGGSSRVLEVSAGTATLTGLTLQNGSASGASGGGVLVDSGATAALVACTLTQNSADNDGGGLDNAGTVTLSDCTLTSNTTANGSGAGILNSGTATLTATVLSYDFALAGVGGGLDNSGGTATVTDCVFNTDYAGYGGGLSNSATVTLSGCILTNNIATNGNGGGVLNSGTATLTDCALTVNSANYGGALDNSGTATLAGCTLTQNGANYSVGGLNNESAATATLTDDIFYSDGSGEIGNGGSATASYCDIQETLGGGGDGVTDGGGNINADPTFVAAPSDLHLQNGSPCAGAGVTVSGLTTDLDGRARPGSPAIGACEAAPAGAYGLVVANTSDSVPQSLRAAVACADDYAATTANITFDAANAFATFQDITLTSGELDLSQSLTITGPSAGVALDGGGGSRVLEVSAGTAALTGLTLQNGSVSGGSGGGVLVDSGATASLTGCLLAANTADSGGGLANNGTASLTDCTLTGNGTTSGNGGGLENAGTASLTDCTVTGNSAPNGVGGGLDDSAAVTLTDDILSGDSAGSNNEIGNSSYITATYCDIAQSNGVFTGTGNINADPLLSALGTYGGPTQTFALLPGSPCIGAGVSSGAATDQRGVSVPQGARYDIGAFESQGFTLAYGSGDGQTTPISTAFTDPLVVTVTSAQGEPVAGGQVTFSAPVSGASASLATSPAAIGVGGTASVTATANGVVGGPYTVTPAANGASGTVSFSLTNSPTPVVPLISTTLTVASSAPTSVYGQSVTFTATTTGLPDGAAITFTDGQTTLGTGTVAGGTATFTTAGLGVGGHTITATYVSDGTYQGASNTVTQQVNQAATTTGLVSSLNPSSVGQSVTFTATVSGSGATGTVTFTDTSTNPATTLGTGTLSNGTATYTTAALSVGSHTITATYGGDSSFAGSAGSTLTQSVRAVLHTFPAGLQMIALDESYGSAAAAWSAPTNQNLYTWGGTAYSVTTSLPAPGQGAWVRLAQPVTVYDTGAPAAGPVSLSLSQGWNLVGDPFGASVPLSSLSATAGGTTYSLGSPQLIVYTTLYTYPAGATAYQAVGPGSSLSPFAGYWLYAFQPCTLTVPAPAH